MPVIIHLSARLSNDRAAGHRGLHRSRHYYHRNVTQAPCSFGAIALQSVKSRSHHHRNLFKLGRHFTDNPRSLEYALSE